MKKFKNTIKNRFHLSLMSLIYTIFEYSYRAGTLGINKEIAKKEISKIIERVKK